MINFVRFFTGTGRMAGHNQDFRESFEPSGIAGAMSGRPSYNQYPSHHRRQSSIPEEMLTIDETREEDFSDQRPLAKDLSTIGETPVLPSQRNNSIMRRITTRLRSGGGTLYRSRPSQRMQYANIQDANTEIVPVDLSSLGGLGFELKEVPVSNAVGLTSPPEEDTAYHGATSSAPSFQDFRRRTLGYGMVVGAQLERNTSMREPPASATSIESPLERMKTVRQVGRSLAEERGQMVAVDEVIDLSSFAGPGPTDRHSKTFDEMTFSRASTIPDTKSYFFPPDPSIPNWKPFSMTPAYIVMLALIAFGLAGFQEYLCQVSIRKQNQTPKSALLAFDSVDDVSVWYFFIWKYLPTMITIFYSVLFSIMDFDIRRLEPYYQLSKPDGARAAASLNLDHLTMFQYFVPFNAARLGQWTVFASSVANILAATIAPAMQNPSVNFEPNPDCRPPNGTCPQDGMRKFWVLIDTNWSRALTAAYVVVGLIALFLLNRLRRKSGLLEDPKGIAGIASMATKSHILQDFKGLDVATRGGIHKRLAHRTYILYKSSVWQGEFISNPAKDEFVDSDRRLHSPHPVMLRLSAGIPFISSMIFCLVMVPVISTTKANVIPNAVPWLPILVATVLKMVWSTFEADVRLMEPFYRLSLGKCSPRNSLTLDYQSPPYGLMPIFAALNKHFLVAVVGICSILLDILSVTIGSFSVDSGVFVRHQRLEDVPGDKPIASGDETYISFWVSLGLSVSILIIVILVACLVYLRRRHPFLPREPSTIASVLAFIYSSKMLTDFIDTEELDSKAMEARLTNLNKTYALGWFKGRDGKVHCAIDEEPMVSEYKHGKPYSDAISGPLQGAETFYYG